MKIISDLKKYRIKQKMVLTIGNFDGVHRGHRKIISRLKQAAHHCDSQIAVLTFEEHPRRFIYNDPGLKLLNFLSHKLTNLRESGVDVCYLVPFDSGIRNLSRDEFLRKFILPEKISKVIVGYDFRFGKGREGSADDVRVFCQKNRIGFASIPAASWKGRPVSSSRIREAVEAGNLTEAAQCLGKPYGVLGRVIRGSGIGRKIGIRTANIKVNNELLPPEGVYYVRVRQMRPFRIKGIEKYFIPQGKIWHGLAYAGPLPAFNQRANDAIIEVFLFRFNGNLYHRFLEVSFLQFIRKPVKVASQEALQALLQGDIKKFETRERKKKRK